MNSKEIDFLLAPTLIYTDTNYLGVFSRGTLPHPLSHFTCAYVANIDPSSHTGTHWVAFYYDSTSELEFFDCYGQSP